MVGLKDLEPKWFYDSMIKVFPNYSVMNAWEAFALPLITA